MNTRTNIRRVAGLLAGVSLAAGLAVALDVPYLGGYVNDTAGVLSNAVISELTELLRRHEEETTNQVVVLTIPSLESESLEEFSMRVVETWKLGRRDRDNGVLLLIARDDRKLRIEVGNGLEGDLTDALSDQIIRHEIVPRFKEGDFDGGVRAGVQAILGSIQGTYVASWEDGGEAEMDPVGVVIGMMVFLIVVGTFTTIMIFTKGFQSWFLYVFLMPFWLAFPYAFVGTVIPFIVYVIGAPVLKWFFASRLPKQWGWDWATAAATSSFFSRSSSGGWSSGRSGGGFSGGGGSFSGGGSSGSW